MASGKRVVYAVRSLVDTRVLLLKCAIALHESLQVSILMYANERMILKEREISRIKAVQRDNLRGLLGIRRMDKVVSARIRELYGVTKGLDEKNDKGVKTI